MNDGSRVNFTQLTGKQLIAGENTACYVDNTGKYKPIRGVAKGDSFGTVQYYSIANPGLWLGIRALDGTSYWIYLKANTIDAAAMRDKGAKTDKDLNAESPKWYQPLVDNAATGLKYGAILAGGYLVYNSYNKNRKAAVGGLGGTSLVGLGLFAGAFYLYHKKSK
jgi:hypothetical protein